MKAKWFSTILILAMLVMSFVPAAGAAPAFDSGDENIGANTDTPSFPQGEEQSAARAVGFEAKLNGKTTGNTHQVAKGQYVELARQGEDKIWTIIGEFGNTIHPSYGGTAGPLHNQLPAPNRAVDNTSIWLQISANPIMKTYCSLAHQALFRCATSTSSSHPTAIRLMVK